ncbi:MAG: enoyl-CoA hydratase-related protein, partial [Alkalispirochaeta sp.]
MNTTTQDTKGDSTLHESVTLHVDDDQLATVTIDLPGKKINTFNEGVLTSLDTALDRIETQTTNGGIKGVIIRSGKPGSFIAGADINLIAELESAEEGSRAAEAGQRIFNRIHDLPVPTIALIDGICLGGGLELALSCDYRIATPDTRTRMGLPETQLGVLPGWGGTFRLPRIVGIAEATKMILTGGTVSGDKALRTGLVDLVYPAAFLKEWGRAALLSIVTDGSHPSIAKNHKRAEKRRNGFLEKTAIGRSILFNAATKDVRKRTGGHYPAQLMALSVLKKTARSSRRSLGNRRFRAKALTLEHNAFGRLAITPECDSLIQLFFARESVKRLPILEHAPEKRVERAAVLGAGVMGGKIAWL